MDDETKARIAREDVGNMSIQLRELYDSHVPISDEISNIARSLKHAIEGTKPHKQDKGDKMTEILDIKRVEAATPPDGEYTGSWGGYMLKFVASGSLYNGRTKDGVRGVNIPIVVTVVDGQATFQTVRRTADERERTRQSS